MRPMRLTASELNYLRKTASFHRDHAATDRLAIAIADALRIPDCKHQHSSWPSEDVASILRAIDREGFIIVAKGEIDALKKDIEKAFRDFSQPIAEKPVDPGGR